MAQISWRTAVHEAPSEPLSAIAGVRVIVALSALGWCALLGALLALL